MAVMSLRWLVAASAWLPAVRAGLEREKPGPWGAVQTPAAPFDFREAGLHLAPPAVTPRPAPRGVLRKRETNTCGYIEGNSLSAYICANSVAQCLKNDEASAVGCCLTTSCNIYTACLDFTSSAATATPNPDSTRTRYCSNSNSPSCAVLKYADPTNSLSGFTIPVCDTVKTTYSFYFSSFGANTRRTSTRSTSTSAETSESSDADATTTNPTRTRGPAATTTPGSNDDNNQPPVQQSSTPVAPIVGGVVGGVAALALIGLGIFFLVRRKKQSPSSPPVGTVPPASAPGPGLVPPPGQGPYPHQTPSPPMAAMPGTPGSFDPRYSIAKPPGASEVSPMQGPPLSPMQISPSNSPQPPVFHSPMQPMAAIPPHEQIGGTPPPHPFMGTPPPQQYPMGTPPPPGHGPYVPYPGPGPQHMQPPQNVAVELPTQRGDGQVHELS